MGWDFTPIIYLGLVMPFQILAFAVGSIIAIVLTKKDKKIAKQNDLGESQKDRISESSLMLAAIFFGATAMLITMLAIRHKTKNKKFMVGLPLLIVLHLIITIGIILLVFRRRLF